MNFLHLVPKHTYETKMARERFRWMDYVNEQMQLVGLGHGVHTTGPGWGDWDDTRSLSENITAYMKDRHREELPHMIVSYNIKEPMPVGFEVPTAVIIQEAYNRPKTLKTIRDADAKLVFFTYFNEIKQYQAELESEGRTVVHNPHCADDYCFKDYGLEKSIDVLIVGSMNQTTYPFRSRLARLAWRELRKRGYRVEWLAHPGYVLGREGAVVGEAFARRLNMSKLVVTCSSTYRYALAKFCEIPLCRALPVSDVPLEREAFFDQTMLHVEPWMIDREILYQMENLLDDDAELQHRVKVARDKIEFRLVMKYWAERFIYHARRRIGEVDMAAPMPLTDEHGL